MGDRDIRRSRWARPRSLRRAALAAALWAATGASALAFGPGDVLEGTPESERTLRQAAAVARAERALDASRAGTTARLGARPELAYGADVEDPAAFGATLDVDLELGWRSDQAAVLDDAADLLAERAELRHARRRDVLDALRLHGAALVAEVALARAELTLTGSPDGSLEQARDRALVERRRHRLDELEADTRALGFDGEARFEVLAFALPEAAAEPPEAARLRLELEAARHRRDALVFEVVRDVTLDASYESRTDGYQLGARLGLDRGRPEAALAGELGPQQDDQWRIALSARIVVDGADAARRADADERVRRAQAALDDALASYPERLRRARSALDDARELLAIELMAWRRAAELARAAADAGDGALRRACQALLSRENAAVRAWLELVSATFDVLETLDGTWQAASPSARPAEGATSGPGALPPAFAPPVRPAACTAAAG